MLINNEANLRTVPPIEAPGSAIFFTLYWSFIISSEGVQAAFQVVIAMTYVPVLQ